MIREPKTIKQSGYGCRSDRPDFRDFYYDATEGLGVLPKAIDERPNCAPVCDQGDLGSCTANAIASAIDFARKKEKLPLIDPSRLFIYYDERRIEGTVTTDSGAEIRDGLYSVHRQGVCPGASWPYIISRFATKPPAYCYDQAMKDVVSSYSRVDNSSLLDMKHSLANGLPFVFGISVYDSFESDLATRTGNIPLPLTTENLVGGHALLAVGYDDYLQVFRFQNSWGMRWGDQGFGTIPYNYLTNTDLTSDCWNIKIVTQK
jgi:C1A family cysteine protease